MSLLQPSASSSSSNSTAASWCNGRIDECLGNAEAGDEGTDDVLDPMVDFSEISRRVLRKVNHVVPSSENQFNALCGKPPNRRYKPCLDAIKNGGIAENCNAMFKKGC